MSLQIGEAFPDVRLDENTPDNKVGTSDALSGKKVVVVGIPGAFTPTCQNQHLPSYVEQCEALKAKGVEEIWCISVNDAFVQSAFSKKVDPDQKLRFLADPRGELTAALGTELDLTEPLGTKRTRRFSALVDNGVIRQFNVEEGGGTDVSMAEHLLEQMS